MKKRLWAPLAALTATVAALFIAAAPAEAYTWMHRYGVDDYSATSDIFETNYFDLPYSFTCQSGWGPATLIVQVYAVNLYQPDNNYYSFSVTGYDRYGTRVPPYVYANVGYYVHMFFSTADATGHCSFDFKVDNNYG